MKKLTIGKHTYNTNTLLWMIILFAAGLLAIIEGTIIINTLITWDYGGISEYQGNYNFSIKKYVRNTNYLFLLDNGDTLEIPCEDIILEEYKFDNTEPLRFTYLTNTRVFNPKAHVAIAITTIDNGSQILYKEFIKSELIIYSMFFFVLGLLSTFISIIPFCYNIYIKSLKARRNFKKCIRTNQS